MEDKMVAIRRPEEQLEVAHRAVEVCEAISRAGLPVIYGGSSFDGLAGRDGSGALVYYDPASDDSFGVYVYWKSSPVADIEIRQKLVSGAPLDAGDLAQLSLTASFTSVMHIALGEVLSVQGWRVVREDVGGSEALRVTREEGRISGRFAADSEPG